MLIFFPIGLKDATVNRVPWVCIIIALATVGAFVHTTYLADSNSGAEAAKLEELINYWQEHPYLEPSDAFKKRYFPDGLESAVEEMQEAAREAGQIPDDFLVEDQQRSFDRMCADFLRLKGKSLTEQWALVPARGYAQKGLIGYIFIHAGWMHLIFNLLFLYVVGPFLEDKWGRLFFLLFYLVGGVAAGAAQVALDTSSPIPIVGASGAVAACMGAFALRFTTRGVRIFYWFLFIFVGTFTVPAWLWTGFWLAREIAAFKLLGSTAQVAFMAHIGGFLFGVFFALLLKVAHFERLFLQPGLDQAQGIIRQNPNVERGMAALHAGQRDVAKAAFRRALQEDVGNVDAALGLARLAADAGDAQGATRALGHLLNDAITKNDDATIKNAIDEVGTSFEPKALRPAMAFRLAERLAKKQPELAVECYRAAASGERALAGKALLHAADLLMNRLSNAREAFQVAQEARAADITPDQKQQIDALLAQAGVSASPEYGTSQERDLEVASLELDLGGASAPARSLPNFADPSAVDLDVAPAASNSVTDSPMPSGGLELDLDTGPAPASSPSAVVDPTAVDLSVSGAPAGLELDIGAPTTNAPDALEIDLSSALPAAAPSQSASLPQAAAQSAPVAQAAPIASQTPQPAVTPAAPQAVAASPTARAPGPPTSTARAPGAPAAERRSSREVVPLGKPVVEMSRFVGRFDNGLTVQMAQGAKVNLSFSVVSSVAFGVVNEVPGRNQRVLVLDLVLPPRQGTLRVLRFFSDSMGLDKLYPAGTPPMEALRTLVFGLAERTKVRPPADADKASRGDYPRFGTLAEYESTYYG